MTEDTLARDIAEVICSIGNSEVVEVFLGGAYPITNEKFKHISIDDETIESN